MYISKGMRVFSPSDLTLYMDSEFASWMERLRIEHPDRVPEFDETDSMMALLQNKGVAHEQAVLQDLIEQGLSVTEIAQEADESATIAAMEAGADVIFQAILSKPPFKGYADFLVKVPGDSNLGDYHYEVWDTKLSQHMKPYFVVQLCCYEDMLETIQGRRSDSMAIVLGDGVQERLRVDDYFYFYRSLKTTFLDAQTSFSSNNQPDPADSKSWGRWESYAKQLLIERDHLSQVATLSHAQVRRLNQAGILSMQDLVDTELKFVPNINEVVFQRLKTQARLQKESAGKDIPAFEILPSVEGEKKGLALLPPCSDLDVFFDIEGFPLVEGGLEYLWGNTYIDERGDRQFKDFWAHNPEQEKQCFQGFVNWVYARWQRDPLMHIYHYANYEIAACRKLMSRYGVCEYEVDQLLRNEVFVDLYKVVKGGLIIGEPNYSIKSVEHLYRSQRETEVGSGSDSVVVYENWRENPDGDTWQTSKILNDIRDYNIDDCESTQELVVWLRDHQKKQGIAFVGITEVIEAELSEEVTERTKLRDQLLTRADALKVTDKEQASLTENLAWVLEFHRREAKPVFWKLFDRLGLSEIELIDDLDCLAGCEWTNLEPYKLTPRKKKLCYEYRFDANQKFRNVRPKDFYILGLETDERKKVKASLVKEKSNLQQGRLVLESGFKLPSNVSLVPDEFVRPDPIPQALEDVIRRYSEGDLKQCAIIDFLKRRNPRIKGLKQGQAIAPSHNSTERLEQITQAVINLDHSYLPIQGPPGAGKTFTGKHVIAELLKRGKKVGICSNSHKAINNLLLGTARYCKDEGILGNFLCTKETDLELVELDVSILRNKDIVNHLEAPCVVGTTAWGFSRDDLTEAFDYLFIDEAGQVSIANLIAISRSADNLVLMGDQMQLGQPAQGTHPAQSGLSILDYLLHHQATIEDHQGVFLSMTYRMHSAVNQFISQAIYNGKLESDPANDNQVIDAPSDYQGPLNKPAGMIYFPVDHVGNSQASEEEVETIVKLAQQLLGRIFHDKQHNTRPIGWGDILFVAPYNHQVNLLKMALDDQARVGSVDKFQGQEAPIVFLSMCSSKGDESSRGIDFLFDKNRINVAISRAQSLAIVVGSPSLAITSAGSVRQQSKINLFSLIQQIGT